MATHDYVIDNSTGANVRADLNLVLQAILSNNSSSSAPSTTAAYMWWADTTNGILKIRNSANNAWVELLQLDGTLTLEDGSASTPALAFRDDLNTGIFSSAADTFNVATGGVERMELGATTIFNEDGADVDFRIEGDTEANLFYVNAGTDDIGIGTSSPSGASGICLEINGGSGQARFVLKNSTSGSASTDGAQIFFDGTTLGIQNREAGSTTFETNGGERLRIDSVGKVLVGTSTSSTVGNSQYSKFEVCGNTSNAAGAAHITIKAGTTTASQTNGNTLGRLIFSTLDGGDYAYIQASIDGAMGSSDFPGRMMFFTCADGASTATERMRIHSSGIVTVGESGGSVYGGQMVVSTLSGGVLTCADLGSGERLRLEGGSGLGRIGTDSNHSLTFITNGTSNERMRIDTSGNVLIGTTDTNLMTSGGDGDKGMVISQASGIQVKATNHHTAEFNRAGTQGGNVLFFHDGTEVGNIAVTSSATSYNTSSDYRLKENESLISDGITRLKQLKPYRFNWKSDSLTIVDGFFAHEVSSIVPESITGTKDAVAVEDDVNKGIADAIGEPIYQSIDQSKLVPLLVAAVQELITKVETLEAA